jgi:hypothetical protein
MKNKVRMDKEKANSLMNMAQITLERLNSIDKLKYPSNTLTDFYDILHKLMESYSSLKGLKFKGENAHKELIDYICQELFNSRDRIFLQEVRQFRNQIAYEGFNIDKNYLERNIKKIEGYIQFIRDKINSKLNNGQKKNSNCYRN